MKKLYNINDKEFGIDFRNVLCFYIDGKIDTYHGFNTKYLNILIGTKYGEPNKLTLIYTHLQQKEFKYEGTYKNGESYWAYEEIPNDEVHRLYQDLIEYFRNEK